MRKDFMGRAVELARKNVGMTSPNPCVGAVIVKGDRIIAEGFHKGAGNPHAEAVVVQKLMEQSGITTCDLEPRLFENATLYTTLEPCAHFGKTPPCSDLVIRAGFRKVCIAMKDPFSRVNGKGIRALKKSGVDVEICNADTSLARSARNVNQAFIKWAKLGVPYVVLKAGMSLDGKIASVDGDSKWITSDEARADARIERSMCDAVLVGRGTVLADDPELGAHGKFRHKQLLRVVVDPILNLSLKSKVFRDENVFVATTELASAKCRERYKKAGIAFKTFGKERVSVKSLLKFLARKKDVQSVFVEGGCGIHGAFVDAALRDKVLVDRVLFYVAPKLIGGGKALSVVGGDGSLRLSDALEFEDFGVKKVGKDLKVGGFFNFY